MDLSKVKCFILDMDGTFYLGDRLLPGALRFIEVLRRQGRDYLFLTNNSSKDPAAYAEKLTRLGFPTEPARILTSGDATIEILLRERPGARVDLFGTPALRRQFLDAGVALDEAHPDVVVLGFDQTIDYPKLVRLCDHVRRGVPFWATHPDFNCPTDGGEIPDTGSMLALVEASTRRRPDRIIGKPYADIVRAVLARTGRAPEELAICGDRLYTDILTGLNAGIATVLVLSGETTATMLAASETKPHFVFANLGELAERL